MKNKIEDSIIPCPLWMIRELKLKDTELFIFAYHYQFRLYNEYTYFNNELMLLWCKSQNDIDEAINSLMSKNYIDFKDGRIKCNSKEVILCQN